MKNKIKKSSNPKSETAWKWFAKYIKLRDAYKTTGDYYYCKCITCGEIKPLHEIDAGHAIGGRSNAVLFNEDLVHGQCQNCNRVHGGEYQMFKTRIIEMYGQGKWDYWWSTKNEPVKYTDFDYEQIGLRYREKIKIMKIENLYGIP